jgi:hypothetical protein
VPSQVGATLRSFKTRKEQLGFMESRAAKDIPPTASLREMDGLGAQLTKNRGMLPHWGTLTARKS